MEHSPDLTGLDSVVLPLVLPAAYRHRHIVDTNLHDPADGQAATARARADVLISRTATRDSSSPCVIVIFAPASADRNHAQAFSAVRRVTRSLLLKRRAWHQRRVFRARGFRAVVVVLWDNGHRLSLPGLGRSGRPSLAERFPQRAVVAAYRSSERTPTLLDQVLNEAEHACGHRPRVQRIWAKGGVLVVIADAEVIRIALGGAGSRIERAQEALLSLSAAGPPAVVTNVVPRVLIGGRTSGATWTVEERLPGHGPSLPMTAQLRAACVDFLAALHHVGRRDVVEPSLLAWARTVTRHCDPEAARIVDVIAGRAADELSGFPTGFGHGDFTPGNVLVDGDRMVGVIDWEGGGRGHLAGLDLLHLLVREGRARGSHRWGAALLAILNAWQDYGLPSDVSAYAERLDVNLNGRRQRALAVAYWLQRLDYRLGALPEDDGDPAWLQRNLHDVLARLASLYEVAGR